MPFQVATCHPMVWLAPWAWVLEQPPPFPLLAGLCVPLPDEPPAPPLSESPAVRLVALIALSCSYQHIPLGNSSSDGPGNPTLWERPLVANLESNTTLVDCYILFGLKEEVKEE
jgi:hypothetical protein